MPRFRKGHELSEELLPVWHTVASLSVLHTSVPIFFFQRKENTISVWLSVQFGNFSHHGTHLVVLFPPSWGLFIPRERDNSDETKKKRESV